MILVAQCKHVLDQSCTPPITRHRDRLALAARIYAVLLFAGGLHGDMFETTHWIKEMKVKVEQIRQGVQTFLGPGLHYFV